MSEPTLPQLPRELVLASAGTGKTFRISSRIIALLARGVPAETIFASTFTRKAAGEILDRVLVRLAEAATDPAGAERLAEFTALEGVRVEDARPEAWLSVLRRLVRDLHRVNVGTLDSFFVRTATIFAEEIGLPQGWRIAEQPVMDRVRADAVHEVLASGDPEVVLELVRAVGGSEAGRSVHERLLSRARSVIDLHHALDPDVVDPWSGLASHLTPVPDDLDAECERLARALEAARVPLTASGTPVKSWVRAMARAAEDVRSGSWEELVGSTLCAAATCEGGEYDRKPVPPEVCELFGAICRLARSVLGARLLAQGRAMGRLAQLLAAAVEKRQRELGAYDFADLTRLIAGPDPLGKREDLYYRLDARTQHILLDEFQDTSLAQWEALEPLMGELLSGYEGERAAVVVADPKQSIYAWRGGEPLLVRHIGETFQLERADLHESFRSSAVVLDFVNTIFGSIDASGAWGDDEVARAVAADWMTAFRDHTARHDLPGHVRVEAGPEDEGRGSSRPRLCRRAADLVAELHFAAPGMTIGVLTRTNRTVARIMMGLRDLGVPASEEGGNPLTDSAAVASVLALLRLADHPGDGIARYHVAGTPIGAAVGLEDHRDDRAAGRVAHEVRQRLLVRGYGRTLSELNGKVAGACSPRERRRMDQLVELAHRYDDRATLRVSDFLRLVDSERIEDPTTADVRVMTVHQSKGLEFDIVVLPDLDSRVEGGTRGAPPPVAYRPGPGRRATRAFPHVRKASRGLFSDVEELTTAMRDARAGAIRDALSGLYVGLTRARHAVHVVVQPDGPKGMGSACTSSAIVRHAVGATYGIGEGEILFESGDARWFTRAGARAAEAGKRARSGPPAAPAAIALRTGSPRTRGFVRTAPSELAAGSKVDLRMVLNLRSAAAVEGTIAHAWMELIGWIEDGLPTEAELRAAAEAIDPRLPRERLDALLTRWNAWLRDPVIRAVLSRDEYGDGATYEREVRFIHRDQDAVLEGAIDRLVLLREGGRVTGAVILDYKTDALESADPATLAAKAEMYRPQLDAYRRAVAGWYGISTASVACRLVVLEAGAVVAV